jgi:hypothetical protein
VETREHTRFVAEGDEVRRGVLRRRVRAEHLERDTPLEARRVPRDGFVDVARAAAAERPCDLVPVCEEPADAAQFAPGFGGAVVANASSSRRCCS